MTQSLRSPNQSRFALSLILLLTIFSAGSVWAKERRPSAKAKAPAARNDKKSRAAAARVREKSAKEARAERRHGKSAREERAERARDRSSAKDRRATARN